MGMGEFNSDDHYIYYYGQGSLRRNGVALIVNKRVRNAFQFGSVAQLCPTLCDPMDCSTPGFPVLQYIPEFAQTHAHWIGDAIQPSHPLSEKPFSFHLQSSPASGSFPMSQFFASCGQSIGVSASTSVPQMNIHDWFPLGLTYCIHLIHWLKCSAWVIFKNDRMICLLPRQTINITVIQVYAPTSNDEDAEVEQF